MDIQTDAQQTLPAFPVFKVVVALAGLRGENVVSGNGILLNNDPGRGIFVTTAHGINYKGGHKTNECYIYLPHTQRFHKADTDKDWINWDTHLAYVRLTNVDLSSYPKASLKTSGFTDNENIQVVGYKRGKDFAGVSFELPARVMEWNQSYGLTLPMKRKVQDMESRSYVARDDRPVLYKKYIWISGEQDFVPTMSGAALVDQEGKLAGILARGGWRRGLALPSSECASFKFDRVPGYWPSPNAPSLQPSLPRRAYNWFAGRSSAYTSKAG